MFDTSVLEPTSLILPEQGASILRSLSADPIGQAPAALMWMAEFI
jgi:hypothetical protein